MEQLLRPHNFAWVFYGSLAVWSIINFWGGRKHKPTERTKSGRRSDLLVFFGAELGLGLGFLIKLLAPKATIYSGGSSEFWLGLALLWAGTLLRQTAIKTLGKYHVMTIITQDKQPVITGGVYRFIRHPSYLGALISVFGVGLSLDSLPGTIVTFGLTLVVVVHRIGVEEAYLNKHLGKSYTDYSKHTNRLVPYVW